MNPVSPTRRSAERFDAALRGTSTGVLDPDTARLVELVSALRTTAPPTGRTTFVADLRSRLLLAAETELAPSRPPVHAPARPARSRRERRIAIALSTLALVGATGSMALAAQSALPGEALYPLKRAIEDVDTGLSAESEKGPALLDHASSRLVELDELSRDQSESRDGDGAMAVIESTLDSFSDQADDASAALLSRYAETGDPAAIDQLHVFAGESLASLGRLEADLPAAARPAVLDAARTLFRIDDAATQACPECAALGITQVPGTLVSADLPDQTLTPPSGPAAVPQPDVTRSAKNDNGGTPGKPKSSAPQPATPTPGADPTPQPTDAGTPPAKPDVPKPKAPSSTPVTLPPIDLPSLPPVPDLGLPVSTPTPSLPLPLPEVGGVQQGTGGGLDPVDPLLP